MSEICAEIWPFRATVETPAPALMQRFQSQRLVLFLRFSARSQECARWSSIVVPQEGSTKPEKHTPAISCVMILI